jgi:hypothetical protein
VDITADGGPPVAATATSVRAAFDPDGGFWDFVVLSRGDSEFIQAGHWWFMGRNTDTSYRHAAFDAATSGMPDPGGLREPELYAVEFRDAAGLFGGHQVLQRCDLLGVFLAYLDGGSGWRTGLSWEPVAAP